MTKEIIAFFTSGLLCVAVTIPVHAEEKTGIVAAVDPERSLVTFDDGSTYRLRGRVDYAAIAPGMEAHVILGESSIG